MSALGGFLPPVVFEVQANATQALATFSKVNGQLKTMEAQAVKTGAALTKMQKTMVYVNATAKASVLIFGAMAAIGINEISQLEASFARLGQAMSNAGISTEENRKKAAELSEGMDKLGFDAAEAAAGLAVLVTATGDFNKSSKMMALAADVARAKHMGLEETARTLARASQGNAKAFKEFGIALDANKPQAEAVAEAMAELERRLGGQAIAYTKTFRGQIEVLREQFLNLTESIGATLLPVLKAFITGIQTAGKFLSKHKEILIGIASVITGIVIVAVVNLTKKLYLQAVAWAAANWEITLIIAAIVALASAFAWAWNKFDWFRKAVVEGLKVQLSWWGFLLRAIGVVAEAFLNLVKGPVTKFLKVMGLFNDDAKKMAAEMENMPKKVGDWFDNAAEKVEGFTKVVDKWKDKKINISLSGIKIPDFGLGTGGGKNDPKTVAQNIVDALTAAKQKIADNARAIKEAFGDIKNTYDSVMGLDWKGAVENELLQPTQKLIKQGQEAANAYAESSSAYTAAVVAQKKASDTLLVAIAGNNKATILAAQSAYDVATKNVQDLQKTMQKSIEEISQFQQDAIQAIVEYTNEIKSLEDEITDKKAAALKEQLALETTYNNDVATLRRENALKVLEATQDVEKRRAEILKASQDQLRGVFRNATQSSVGDLFKSLTFDGRYLAGGGIGSITDALKKQLNKATTLAEDASALAGQGFSQTFIEQVIAQGPELGHELAQSILTASPDSIAELKKYWDGLEKVSQHGVDVVATTLNQGMNLATQELRDQLAAVEAEFVKTLNNLAQELLNSLTEKQTAYDAATAAIKAALEAELKVIDDKIDATKKRITELQAALTALSGLQTPGAVQGPIDLTPTPAVAEAEEAARVAEEAARAAEEAIAAAERAIADVDSLLVSVGIDPSTIPATSTDNWASDQTWWRSGGYGAMTDAVASKSITTTQFTGSALAGSYTKEKLADPTSATTTVNNNVTINASTDASPAAIAQDVGWAIRTSGDMTYQQIGKSGKWIPVSE